MKFEKGMFPSEFETCDWQFTEGKRGRKPAFWKYVKHSACHYLVNFNLKLAYLVEPQEKWRILTSDKHSTVWNGKNILFDFNFTALNVKPIETFNIAKQEELPVKTYIPVGFAPKAGIPKVN